MVSGLLKVKVHELDCLHKRPPMIYYFIIEDLKGFI